MGPLVLAKRLPIGKSKKALFRLFSILNDWGEGGGGRGSGGSEVSGRTFPFYRKTEVGKMTMEYLLPLSLSTTSLTFKKGQDPVLTTLDLWKGRGRRHDVILH
jgi:hypothetical protein